MHKTSFSKLTKKGLDSTNYTKFGESGGSTNYIKFLNIVIRILLKTGGSNTGPS